MKRFLALLLCVVLAVSSVAVMTGCSGGENNENNKTTGKASDKAGLGKTSEDTTPGAGEDVKSDVSSKADYGTEDEQDVAEAAETVENTVARDGIDEELLGHWAMPVELGSLVPEITDDEQLKDLSNYMPGFEELVFELSWIFYDNNKATMGIDEESAIKVVDEAFELFKQGVENYINDLIAESEDALDIGEVLEILEYDTMDELLYDMFDREEILQQLGTGTYDFSYYADNGVMYLTDTPEEEINSENYTQYAKQSYKIKGDVLEIEGVMEFTKK